MDWSTTATHHIINNPSTNHDNLEIHRKGRIVLLSDIKTHFIGKPELRLTTPKIDGEVTVAAAKLKATFHGCRVLLGDPDKSHKKDWQETETSDSFHTRYQIVYGGETYFWKRLNIDSQDKLHDLPSGEHSMEFVSASNPEVVLAVYQKCVGEGALPNQKARVDYMQDLGQDLEYLCLVAAMGLAECQAMDRKWRDMPLNQGPPPLVMGGPAVGTGW